ncbi:MAG: hypothetical protein WAN03_18350 [Candidatus Sulfotelmatobacter sp.]
MRDRDAPESEAEFHGDEQECANAKSVVRNCSGGLFGDLRSAAVRAGGCAISADSRGVG